MTTTMLHVSASPRGAESESLTLASAFLDGYRDAHPDHHIDTFDLWDGSLPEFGPAAARAKIGISSMRPGISVAEIVTPLNSDEDTMRSSIASPPSPRIGTR